ncbi:MAG: MFS transporter [Armatimonadota bacterium]|nr:MFS transporter [Armatimonadota bacterium]
MNTGGLRILGLTTLQQVGLTLVRFGLPVLIPFIRRDLDLSVLQVGMLLTALDLGSFAAFVPAGLATDRIGERRVLVGGGVLMGTVAALTALAPSYPVLLVGLALAGLGFPSGHTGGSALVMRRFPPRARGGAIGVRQSGLPVGGALAALAIPYLSGVSGWRTAMAAAGLACASLGALCVLLPRDDRRESEPRGGRSPLAELAWDRGYALLTLMATMLVIAQFSLQGYYALFLVDQHAWTPQAAGRVLVWIHLGGVAGRLAWGWASDRLAGARRRPVLVWVIAAGVLLLIGLARFPAGAAPGLAAAVALAGGMLLAGWNGLAVNLIIERAGSSRAATALGASLTIMYLGTMASYPIFGSVVQAAHAYGPAWLLVAACQAVALILLMRVREG